MSYLNLFSNIGILLSFIGFSITANAQQNTDVKSVDIVSAFRPQVMKSSKFNFLPSLPIADSARIQPTYVLDFRNYSPGFKLSIGRAHV